MREGMVRRRGLNERRRTFTGGSTRDAYGGPYARRIATDALLRESEPHERTTGGGANHEDSRRAWTSGFRGRQNTDRGRGAARPFESTCLRQELCSM